MKKLFKITFLGLCLTAMCSFGFNRSISGVYADPEDSSEPVSSEPVSSEPAPIESSEPELISSEEPVASSEQEPTIVEPLYNATIVVEKLEHGSIITDIEKGNAGDVCTINIEPDMFYVVDGVTVNGTALVEDVKISGQFSFILVEGENKITAKVVIDEELLGKLSGVVEKASNGDWTDVFSVRNILMIVGWILDGGLLIVIVRYFIKDKRLADSVTKTVQDTTAKILPEETKKHVLEATEKVITPLFTQIEADNAEIKMVMGVFIKCFALSQENTPESRRAILDELANLKLGDANTIEGVKKYIDEAIERYTKSYQDTLAAIKEIGQKNQDILDESEEKIEEPKKDNGTQI